MNIIVRRLDNTEEKRVKIKHDIGLICSDLWENKPNDVFEFFEACVCEIDGGDEEIPIIK